MAFQERRKTHVAALGHRELHRLLEPLKQARVDRFFLLEDFDDQGKAWYKRDGRNVDVEALLEGLDLEHWTIVPVRMWDPHRVAAAILGIAAAEPSERVYVNVSTGPKTIGVGATLASLFSNIALYYAEVDYDEEEDPVWGRHVTDVQRIPTFRADPPDILLLRALKSFAELAKPAEPRVLKARLKEAQPPAILPPAGQSWDDIRYPHQVAHAQFEKIRRRLEDLGAIGQEGTGRRRYHITNQGRAILRMFAERVEMDGDLPSVAAVGSASPRTERGTR